METSTASTVIPTLKRIRDFLSETIFDEAVQFLADSLADVIDSRVAHLAHNSILQMATLLDPRFAYEESIWRKTLWSQIEDDLKNFAKKQYDEHHPEQQESELQLDAEVDLLDFPEENSSDESVRCIF